MFLIMYLRACLLRTSACAFLSIAMFARHAIIVDLPLDFILLKHLALGVISDVADVDETTQVQDL